MPRNRRLQTLEKEHAMSPRSLPTLRNLLLIDSGTCATMAALLTLGSGQIGQLTQLPPVLLSYVGLGLFPIAAFMAIVALRPDVNSAATWLIIVGNALWVAGSFLLLASGWIAPNLLGTVFIAAQAVVVALLTKLEYGALRGYMLRPRAS
jgi:hypothetical protein